MESNGKIAIILMGHGSRVPGAGRDMEKMAQLLKSENGYKIVETCFMSRLGPHFPKTLEKCVKAGAASVVLIPYFLNLGLHMKLDIPTMMKKEAEKYPDVKIVFGKNLGFDNLLFDLVKKRVEESKDLDDVRTLELEPKDKYPLPPGQEEFVPMSPEEAKKFRDHSHTH